MANMIMGIFLVAISSFITFGVCSWLDNFHYVPWYSWAAVGMLVHNQVIAAKDRATFMLGLGALVTLFQKTTNLHANNDVPGE